MQVQEDSVSQQAVWLPQATAAKPVGRTLREGMQVYSSAVSMVLQESAQQGGRRTEIDCQYYAPSCSLECVH